MSSQPLTSLDPKQVERVADAIERVWREVGAELPPEDPRTEEMRLRLGRIVLQIASREDETPSSLALKASQAFRMNVV